MLGLIDSISELCQRNSNLHVIINCDSTSTEGFTLAREIANHGNASLAFGNLFDAPIDLAIFEDLKPKFFVRTTIALDWQPGDLPLLSDRTALHLAADLNIDFVLPYEYISRYPMLFQDFPDVKYFIGSSERQT